MERSLTDFAKNLNEQAKKGAIVIIYNGINPCLSVHEGIVNQVIFMHPGLKRIVISGAKLFEFDSILTSISRCDYLEYLELHDNALTVQNHRHLSSVIGSTKMLKSFTLLDSQSFLEVDICQGYSRNLAKCSQLESLSLMLEFKDKKCVSEIFGKLDEMTCLIKVSISLGDTIDDDAVEALGKKLSSLPMIEELCFFGVKDSSKIAAKAAEDLVTGKRVSRDLLFKDYDYSKLEELKNRDRG